MTASRLAGGAAVGVVLEVGRGGDAALAALGGEEEGVAARVDGNSVGLEGSADLDRGPEDRGGPNGATSGDVGAVAVALKPEGTGRGVDGRFSEVDGVKLWFVVAGGAHSCEGNGGEHSSDEDHGANHGFRYFSFSFFWMERERCFKKSSSSSDLYL